MGDATADLMRLRPVTFRYKQPYADGSEPIQYGLIAEEVAEVHPELVARSADEQIETVKHQVLDSMLLNEVQRLNTMARSILEVIRPWVTLRKEDTCVMAIAMEPRLLYVQFHIDTNCINAESTLSDVNKLESWETDEVILPLILSETARDESLRGKGDDPVRHSRNRKRHAKANTHIFTIEESDENSANRYHDVERALFPGGATTDRQKRDVRIVCEAQKYGARVALYGRKINNAENQLAFIEFLRLIADRVITPEEAVRAYHAVLERLGIRPQRQLADDLLLQTNVMSYSGSSSASVSAAIPSAGEFARPPAAVGQQRAVLADGWTPAPNRHGPISVGPTAEACACGGHAAKCECEEVNEATTATTDTRRVAHAHTCSCEKNTVETETVQPDFARMTQAEKLAWNQAYRDRIFGV